MEIEEMALLDRLFDRIELLARGQGALENENKLVRKDRDDVLKELSGLAEMKRLYDGTREELQAAQLDRDRTLRILRTLHDAARSVPLKGLKKNEDVQMFGEALRAAYRRLDEEIPF